MRIGSVLKMVRYPERGGKLGYVIVELKDTEKITKKQYRALNVLRYGGAIGVKKSYLTLNATFFTPMPNTR